PVIREPLTTIFHGLTVEVPPPPSAGGVAVVLMLETLEKLGPKAPPFGADDLHQFAEVARRAHAIRRFTVGDPDAVAHFDIGVKRADWLRKLSTFPPFDPEHATPS